MKNLITAQALLGIIVAGSLTADYGSYNQNYPQDSQQYSQGSSSPSQNPYYQQGQTNYSQQGQNTNPPAQSNFRFSANTGSATSQKAGNAAEPKHATEKAFPKDQFKTDSDRAVNKRIREQIAVLFDGNYGEIILRTSEGTVVIDGIVLTQENQKKLIDGIEQINGVKHVVNNTKVKK